MGGSGGDGEEAGREKRAAQRGLGRGAALRPAREWDWRNGLEDTSVSGSCVGRGEQDAAPGKVGAASGAGV